MYADNTLTPKEAVRLCALGTLASGAMTYAELATSIRHFIDRIQGPSLDVLGSSVQLLKFEGLVKTIEEKDEAELLEIADQGHAELRALLTAKIRASDSDFNKLIEALKFRFLHLLDADERCRQADLLIERADTELARLVDLRRHYSENVGFLCQWLDRDIAELEGRLTWLEEFRQTL